MFTKSNVCLLSRKALLAATMVAALLIPAANRAAPNQNQLPAASGSVCLLRRSIQRSMSAAPNTAGKQKTVPLQGGKLLSEVEQRAFRFFWEKSDPQTGLCNDRAHNLGGEDDYTVASVASTGYALASMPIAARHGWIDKQAAYERTLLTLRFLNTKMPHEHGWFFPLCG